MENTKMLLKNYEFKRVLTKGKFYFGKYISMVVLSKNNKEVNYIGLAVNKKIGKAVKRNRIKRLIRENYKNIEKEMNKGYEIVFLCNKNIKVEEITYKKIKEDMLKLLKKSNLISYGDQIEKNN